MLALDPTTSDSITLEGNSELIAEDCTVQSNSSAADAIHMQGSASAEADEFCAVGTFTTQSGDFSPAPEGACRTVQDPLATLPKPTNLTCSGFPTKHSNGTHIQSGRGSVITGGGDIRFVGTIYLPTQVLSIEGNGEIGADSPAWSMMAARFDFQGEARIHINSDFEGAGFDIRCFGVSTAWF